MPERESSREIDRAAARWAARLDRGALSPEEQRELERWSSADARRLGALARAMAVSAYCDAAAGGEGERARDFAPTKSRAVGRRGFLYAGLAAGVAGLSVAAGGWSWDARNAFSTRRGEFRSVRLPDGSEVWLNTDSRLRVKYSDTRRGVTLLKGEALFEVATDRSRPFIVRARDMDVRAVGTSFSVSRITPDQPVEVLVREGLVDVVHARRPQDSPVHLTAGCRALAAESGSVTVAYPGPQAVSRALAWRRGMLNFEGETLAQAAATFARYGGDRIVLDDPAVSQLTVTGLFAAGDAYGFAKAVAVSLELRVRSGPDGIHLSR